MGKADQKSFKIVNNMVQTRILDGGLGGRICVRLLSRDMAAFQARPARQVSQDLQLGRLGFAGQVSHASQVVEVSQATLFF